MTPQEVAFAHATCRITIEDAPEDPNGLAFIAHMWLLRDGRARPLVLPDGHRAEVYGRTEAMALNSAITYLEPHFGALSEYPHGAEDFCKSPAEGEPFVME